MDVRLVKPLTKQCERARECASLRLDGELSEFEQALLVAHLARCELCRSFAAELESVTDHMRTTPSPGSSSRSRFRPVGASPLAARSRLRRRPRSC